METRARGGYWNAWECETTADGVDVASGGRWGAPAKTVLLIMMLMNNNMGFDSNTSICRLYKAEPASATLPYATSLATKSLSTALVSSMSCVYIHVV